MDQLEKNHQTRTPPQAPHSGLFCGTMQKIFILQGKVKGFGPKQRLAAIQPNHKSVDNQSVWNGVDHQNNPLMAYFFTYVGPLKKELKKRKYYCKRSISSIYRQSENVEAVECWENRDNIVCSQGRYVIIEAEIQFHYPGPQKSRHLVNDQQMLRFSISSQSLQIILA